MFDFCDFLLRFQCSKDKIEGFITTIRLYLIKVRVTKSKIAILQNEKNENYFPLYILD